MRNTRAWAGVFRNLSLFTPAIPLDTSPVDAMIFLILSSTLTLPLLRRPRTTSRTIMSNSGPTERIYIQASGPKGIPRDWKKLDIGLNSSIIVLVKL